jgi:hypothetical protein
MMWRDYVQPISTIAALALSTLALVLAQFPIGSTRAKWTYVLIVIFFNLVAAASVIYSQYYTITKAHKEMAKRENREQLGKFISEGNDLLTRLRDQNAQLADADSNLWGTNVETFLLSKLGQSYVTRFRSDTGILLGQPTNLTGDHLSYWLGVRNRVYNL